MMNKIMLTLTIVAVLGAPIRLGRDGYVRCQDPDAIHSTWSYRPEQHEVRQHFNNGVDLVWENVEEGALQRIIKSGAKH